MHPRSTFKLETSSLVHSVTSPEVNRPRLRIFEDERNAFILPRLPIVERYDIFVRHITVIKGDIKVITVRRVDDKPEIKSFKLTTGQCITVRDLTYIGWRSLYFKSIVIESSNIGYDEYKKIPLKQLQIPDEEMETIVPNLTII